VAHPGGGQVTVVGEVAATFFDVGNTDALADLADGLSVAADHQN
jgi:hypothetical protein